MAKAKIRTRLGDILISFRPDVAPRHVENFLELARQRFYDGCLFHRVMPGFMIQGGDPMSRLPDRRLHGTGGSGRNLKAEFSSLSHVRGAVSMARAQHSDSASSQFFIVVDDSPHLDGQYSIFAQVEEGMEIADRIAGEELDFRNNPLVPVEMTVQVIEEG